MPAALGTRLLAGRGALREGARGGPGPRVWGPGQRERELTGSQTDGEKGVLAEGSGAEAGSWSRRTRTDGSRAGGSRVTG